MRLVAALAAAAAAAALLAAAPAAARTVAVADGELRFSAAPGERNAVAIATTATEYRITDGNGNPTAEPGSGCHALAQHEVRCPRSGVTRAAIVAGDRDDNLSIEDVPVPVTYSGGAGRDDVFYGATGAAVTVTADGVADDGPSGRDNVMPDVEKLIGTSFADRLALGSAAGALRGDQGDDTLTGGPGADLIEAAAVGDPGSDAGGFFPLGTDTIACGGGRDFALLDGADHVAKDCEAIGRPAAGGGYEFRGSNGPDRIAVPLYWAPAVVHGRGGNDLLIADFLGGQRIYGDSGDDRIQHGHDKGAGEPQLLDGGSGDDRIRARDEFAIRDTVRCGRGSDTAIVDRRDRVSGCERVLRARG